uniref:Uncharacterized protein n=1 Tax=Salix viminalis TaxID=40686 RepID=A0A6N2KMP5_SALVM
MMNLEEWETNSMGGREIFTCLHEIQIEKCPKLVELPIIPSVRYLIIEECTVTLLSSVVNFTSITCLQTEGFDELAVLPYSGLKHNTSLSPVSTAKSAIKFSSPMSTDTPISSSTVAALFVSMSSDGVPVASSSSSLSTLMTARISLSSSACIGSMPISSSPALPVPSSSGSAGIGSIFGQLHHFSSSVHVSP